LEYERDQACTLLNKSYGARLPQVATDPY
jgi:hypothetical protein